ncbi:iron-sulfur cluster assembly accessory protein [Candidatus Kapaibacterium sp.]
MNAVINDIDVELIHTGVTGTEEQDAIMVTRRALDKINSIREENQVPAEYALRLGTQSGGCSGMNYILGFDSDVNASDKLIELSNINMVIDNKSIFYLMGVTLDYVDDAYGSGFVFNNPNNAKTCGCGSGGGHH